MGEVGNHVGRAQDFTSRTGKSIGRRVRRVPLCDDVVPGHVVQAIPDRNEIGYFRVPGGDLAVHGVEQAVRRKFRVKNEADEAAFQALISSEGKGRGHVRVHVGFVLRID